ncbi:major facilitator superfamily domain-containing protein [Xylariaceae sp. FL0255]|nr:major facilitator superfamily domain-containing protein [Xylariaceae sp. FL0255]
MATTPKKQLKLPAQQLAILAVARFAEPLAMTSVYPYLPEMIASFGIDQKDVAKWAGATSAVFSVSQSITAVSWGQASDKYGRKPVIMLGLFFTMLLFLVWGVSTNLTMAIIVRALQGAGNGNVGIIRTMVAEMVPERKLQPKAFSIMPLVWSIGSVFGPAFGGLFAKPAEQFPGLFSHSHFFNKYPFALPNILGCLVFLISLSTAALFLKETLHSKKNSRDWGLVLGKRITEAFRDHPLRSHQRLRRYSLQDAEASAPLLQTKAKSTTITTPKVEKPLPSAVFTRQTIITLIAYTFLALHSVAFDQVLPVFLNYTPEKHTTSNTSLPFFFSGGFGLESGRIGTIFTLYGVLCGAIQFVLFPPLCSHFGTLACFKACSITFPIVYILAPFPVLIEDVHLRYTALAVVMLFKAFAVIIGFPCCTILLTNSASSLSVLGTLNGWATTFSALGRASGPALAGVAFSWGVKHNMIGAPWWILAAIAIVGMFPVWMIEEGDGPSGASAVSAGGGSTDSSDSEETHIDGNGDEAVFFEDEDDEDDGLPAGYEDQDMPLQTASRRSSSRSAFKGYGTAS